MSESYDSTTQAIDQFEELMRAFSQRHGVKFWLAPAARADIIEIAKTQPIEEVLSAVGEQYQERLLKMKAADEVGIESPKLN